MLKLFRKIRRKLLDEGNLKKYLIYAVGEILLVVIGILIALQINNNNEKRKRTESEFQIMSELKFSIEQDIKMFKRHVRRNTGVKESCEILLHHLNQEIAYDDSLNYHFNRATIWYKAISEYYAYENAINHGLDFINNDTLRRILPNIYDRDKRWIETMEERQEDYNSSIVIPYKTKYFNSSKCFDPGNINTSCGIVPLNYDQLKNDTYKNILQTLLTYREMDIYHQTTLITKMEHTLNLIDRELDDY